MADTNNIAAFRRNTQSKSYVLSLTKYAWEFQNIAFWDTHILYAPLFHFLGWWWVDGEMFQTDYMACEHTKTYHRTITRWYSSQPDIKKVDIVIPSCPLLIDKHSCDQFRFLQEI